MAEPLMTTRGAPLAGAGLRYASHIGFRPGGRGLLRDIAADDDPVKQVKAAEALGFYAVQDAWALERDERELNRIAISLQIAGLRGGCVVAARASQLKVPLWVRTDAQSREEQHLVALHAIHAAELLSSEVIVVLARRDPQRPMAEQIDAFVENLKWTAELASRRGLIVGLEPMQVLPDMLIGDLNLAMDVIGRVDGGKTGLVFDTFHVHAETANVTQMFVELFDDVLLLQIADRPGRGEAGSGEIDIPGLLSLATRMQFGGLVELEHDWTVADPAMQEERLRRLRSYEDAAGALLVPPGIIPALRRKKTVMRKS
jgi:hydroxypyruvate isomerase